MKPIKIDRRLTGSSFIDEPLQQVCVYVPVFVIGLVIPCTCDTCFIGREA